MAMRSRGVLIASAGLVMGAAALTVMIVVWTPWHPLGDVSIPSPPPSEYFSAGQIDREQSYFEAARWPSWIGLAIQLAVAVVLGFTPVGRRLVALARRAVRRWWLQVPVLTLGFLLIERIATLPTGAWAHQIARDYGLTNQGWAGWARDLATSLAVTVVVLSLVMLAAVGLARRFTRTWFVPAAAGAVALVFAGSFVYPVAIEPLFNRFTSLPDGPLRTHLLELAKQSDVKVDDVLVADASRRTTTLNAYVSGFGATKRIVVYDTLLKSASDREIELIVAHELGHASSDDVLIGTIEGSVAAAMAVLAMFLALRPTRLRRPVGAGSVGDPAIVPVVLALVALVSFFALPLQNAVSRQIEARADAHSLNLTRDPTGFIQMQERLAVTNLDHLDPNPVLSFWFASHPTTMSRIGMALAWERLHGETG
jgi:STE24 endopeptidase